VSYALPTVRVVNPARTDSFITINRADFGRSHELWPEQEEGFTPIPKPKPVFDPAERDLAVEILNRLVPARFGIAPNEWLGLDGAARLDCLRAYEADVLGAASEAAADLLVAKANGPRGLWYVMRGDKRASQGFRTETEAAAERDRMGA
jgi:hypothetical protein